MKNRGFTLIELLVVISIIGFLSSVILASLNSARDKGTDSAVKSNLNNIRAQAEIVNSDFTSYARVCTSAPVDPYVAKMFAAATAAGNNGGACNSNVTFWVAWAGLKANSANAWCVDNTGDAVEIVKPTGVITKCR